MKLHLWMKLTKMSQTELAVLARTSVSTINRHLKHGRVLDPKVVTRIYFITFGAVRPDDFYDLTTAPADLEQLMTGLKSHQLQHLHRAAGV